MRFFIPHVAIPSIIINTETLRCPSTSCFCSGANLGVFFLLPLLVPLLLPYWYVRNEETDTNGKQHFLHSSALSCSSAQSSDMKHPSSRSMKCDVDCVSEIRESSFFFVNGMENHISALELQSQMWQKWMFIFYFEMRHQRERQNKNRIIGFHIEAHTPWQCPFSPKYYRIVAIVTPLLQH